METNVSPELERLCEKLENEIENANFKTINIEEEKQKNSTMFDNAIIIMALIMIVVSSI